MIGISFSKSVLPCCRQAAFKTAFEIFSVASSSLIINLGNQLKFILQKGGKKGGAF